MSPTATDSHSKQPRHVQSVVNGWNVLKVLAESTAPMSLKAISQASDMSPSQAHLYLTSLQMVDVVEKDGETGRYELGAYALELGLAAIRRVDLLPVARPIMSDLREETGEAVFLTVWGNRGPALIHRLDGTAASSRSLRTGYVLPISASASGRLWAAHLPRYETDELLAEEWRRNPELKMPTSKWDTLLQSCLETGLAARVDDEHFAVLSAPVFDHQRTIRATVAITGPEARFDISLTGPHAHAVRAAASRMSHRLGHAS